MSRGASAPRRPPLNEALLIVLRPLFRVSFKRGVHGNIQKLVVPVDHSVTY